jgi:hypothetical protein
MPLKTILDTYLFQTCIQQIPQALNLKCQPNAPASLPGLVCYFLWSPQLAPKAHAKFICVIITRYIRANLKEAVRALIALEDLRKSRGLFFILSMHSAN